MTRTACGARARFKTCRAVQSPKGRHKCRLEHKRVSGKTHTLHTCRYCEVAFA